MHKRDTERRGYFSVTTRDYQYLIQVSTNSVLKTPTAKTRKARHNMYKYTNVYYYVILAVNAKLLAKGNKRKKKKKAMAN